MRLYKIKRFFRKIKTPLYRILCVIFVLLAFVYCVNTLIYEKLIWNSALKAQHIGNYSGAIKLYDFAFNYYALTDFVPQNKQKYLETQYKKALSYLYIAKIKEADLAIKKGMHLIVDSFGLPSEEYAKYIRKYVVNYYIKKQDYTKAKEYLKLAQYFYSKLKTDITDLAEINMLYGDVYMEEQKADIANIYYNNAYRIINNSQELNVDLAVKTTKRLTTILIADGNYKQALVICAQLLNTLQQKNTKDKIHIAYTKWLLGNICSHLSKQETAISYYEDAYAVINKLPDYNEFKKDIDKLRTDMVKCYSSLGRYTAAERIQKQIKLKK